MNADIWDFPLFMTSHFSITVLTSCNWFTQIRMTKSGQLTSPTLSLLGRSISVQLSSLFALRLAAFKLYGPRLTLNHVAYCMLPKCVWIVLKEFFTLFMLYENTLHSYYQYFVCSCNQTGIWQWNWIYIYMCVCVCVCVCATALLVPIKHSTETLSY
jgi:hypothetical protein